MKLIPLIQFVLDLKGTKGGNYIEQTVECMEKVHAYADFLRQPLTLGMFIPCDEDGNVLEKPENYKEWNTFTSDYLYKNFITVNVAECEKYQQAKERILFEGWKHDEYSIVINSELGDYFNVRRLMDKKTDIEWAVDKGWKLTPTALKTIGL